MIAACALVGLGCSDHGSSDAMTPGALAGDAGSMASAAGPTLVERPTWHQHIAPLLAAHCGGCHRAEGIGPFSLTSYPNARQLAPALLAAVQSGQMPPWGARETGECKPRFRWKEDLRLSGAEQSLLERWVKQGAPEGDLATAAPIRQGADLSLKGRSVRTEWAKPFAVPPGKSDIFRCFVLPYTFEERAWITGVQMVPDNSKVVHHALVWLDPDGQTAEKDLNGEGYPCQAHPGPSNSVMIAAWAPGAVPAEMPEGVGIAAKKGSRIVVNVHYHPGQKPETDASSVDLRFTTTKPPLEGQIALIGNLDARQGLQPGPNDRGPTPEFRIPAGARDHVESMQWRVDQRIPIPIRIFGVGTHMHYVGRDMKIEIDRSERMLGAPSDEPQKECLIQTPAWDFNWQRGYAFDAPLAKAPTVSRGDVLSFRCTYDNSMNNPHVVRALEEVGLKEPRDVHLGEMTLDEMCLGAFGVAYPALP